MLDSRIGKVEGWILENNVVHHIEKYHLFTKKMGSMSKKMDLSFRNFKTANINVAHFLKTRN
jgi:hypothetical protein